MSKKHLKMQNSMNWGVIGLGKISHKFASEFELVKDSKILMVGSRETQKAIEFAENYSVPFHGTYDEVLDNDAVNAIYIGTPHPQHFEICKSALLKGKHVLCEKPITINEKEYDELASIAREKDLMLMDAMWTYFLPATKTVKSWIDANRIGRVKYANIHFSFTAIQDESGRLLNPALAGGSLLDIGVYVIYNTFHYFGSDFEDMKCHGLFTHTGVDESINMLFKYKDQLVNGYCSIGHKTECMVEIYGTEGRIKIPLFWKANSCFLLNNEDDIIEEFEDGREGNGFMYQINHFTDCIKNECKESPILPHHLTKKVMNTMDSIRKEIGLKYPMED